MKQLLAATALGGALAAGSLGVASTANATPSSENGYLNELVSHGITIFNAPGAIDRGYQICGMLQHEDGNAAAHELFRSTSTTETPNLYTAQVMVRAAADTLCTWAWQTRVPAEVV
jgi:hypothetical protein